MPKALDIFNIRPIALTDSQRERIRDNAITRGRGLVVDFELSAAGKRINNRIYTPKGQSKNVDSWTEPYPKPILLHHEETRDAIGRIVEVRYEQNNIDQFFPNPQEKNLFVSMMDSDDPQQIYKALASNGLLTNNNWPGVGRLMARAKITDADAIEKFINGLYMTFSAGTTTDRYACGVCGCDWAAGDYCEHDPGTSVDGMPVAHVTGAFVGQEASVVNIPAYSRGKVHFLSFEDSAFSEKKPNVLLEDALEIPFVDSFFEGEPMNEELIQELVDLLRANKDAVAIQPASVVLVTPWKLVAKATQLKVGETLTQEQLDSVPAERWGGEKEFCVYDRRYVVAAREVLADSGLPAEVAAPIIELLDKHAYLGLAEELESAQTELSNIKIDYAKALEDLEAQKQELTILKNKLIELDNVQPNVENNDNVQVEQIQEVVNPAGGSTSVARQDEYTQLIINRYNDLKDKAGNPAAQAYLAGKVSQGLVPRNFYNKYLKESE